MPTVTSSDDDRLATLAERPRPSFAAMLRESTQAVHREAERAGFIADLLHGRATRSGYATYLANLLPVYEALEARLASATGSSAERAFGDPLLARAQALRSDLRALAEDGDEAGGVLPEAQAYAAAIVSCGAGLTGHAYARYLGDLSGGQILKPLLAKTMGLAPKHLALYDFPGLDIGASKAALRAALDAIEARSADAERIIETAEAAFRHTIALSCAVAAAAKCQVTKAS